MGKPVATQSFNGAAVLIASALTVLAVLLVLYGSTALAMVTIWSENSTYNYAFLIPLISLYLVFSDRHRLAGTRQRIEPFGILLCAGFGLGWLIADAADVDFGRQLTFIGLLQSGLFTLLGRGVSRQMMFPIMYLWLMPPMWDFLIPYLQLITLELSVPMIRMTGIPLFVNGFLMEVPSGLYRVAPECSGLNFLLAAAALSLLYGYMIYDSYRKRVICFFVSMLVAILANGIRVAVIVGFNHYGGQNIGIGGDHLTWGWGFFALVVLVMIWFGGLFKDPPVKPQDGIGAGILALPLSRTVVVAAMAALGVIALPSAYANYLKAQMEGDFHVNIGLPDQIGPAKGYGAPSDWSPQFATAHGTDLRRYELSEGPVDLYVAYYANQAPGREIINYNNTFYDRKLGKIAPDQVREVQVDGDNVKVIESHIASARGSRLVWHWYWTDGVYVERPVVAKLYQAKTTLLNGDRRTAFIALSTPVNDDLQTVRARLQALLSHGALIGPLLEGAIIVESGA
ncbi:exosortase A [Aestuariispira insulae]|uniref:Exosortase A n=1 Tax=Aestuariispira insulae TaxID=1461337 RepID=A0A3D9HLU1_9PROT|nr:exosortase A [Aestuariispira insulae]RED49866.1 exosortase A [Aestuariispira insulae]